MFLVLVSLAAVSGLSAPEWSDREAATAALRAAGPYALPALLPLRDSEDPEVRDRVRRLLAPFDRAARDARLLATYVTGDAPTDEQWAALDQSAADRDALAAACVRRGLFDLDDARRLMGGPSEYDLITQWLGERPYWDWLRGRVETARYRHANPPTPTPKDIDQ